MSKMNRTYSELVRLPTIEERFEYLSLRGGVGDSTFGFDRYINQQFYRSKQWKQMRHHIIARDLGRDLAVEGYEIHGIVVIHHMNPMEAHEIVEGDTSILDPEFLISTTHKTHNAIHYGDASLLPKSFVERRPGDTKLW
jgi:hypothetical protein